MKLVNTYPYEGEAHIDAGMLENHGIDCEIVTEALNWAYPTPALGTSLFGLYVPDDRYDEARELLSNAGDK